jgi:prophage antirepressor-like protein
MKIMNELQIFENDEFGKVRTVVIDNEPWMVGKDVADALGYANSRDAISKHVDDEDKGVAKCDTLGGKQDLQIINESGMYDLVFGSKLPTAKKFKHWVTSEVLPALRKTGSYTMPKMSKELQAIVMLDGKQEKLREEFEDFKGEIPLFTTECKEIQGIVRKVGVSALGGKKAPAYQNRSLRSRIYGDIQRELKRQFDVRRYESIHRSQFPIARDIVKNYVVPVALRSEIAKENAQA